MLKISACSRSLTPEQASDHQSSNRSATSDHETACHRCWPSCSRAKKSSLLNEYRTRLIADVVTGKLDVREAAAALSEVEAPDLEDIIGIHGAAAPELAPELEEVAT